MDCYFHPEGICRKTSWGSFLSRIPLHGNVFPTSKEKTAQVGFRVWGLGFTHSHRPLSSSFLGLPHRILNINHKEELLRGLWVYSRL